MNLKIGVKVVEIMGRSKLEVKLQIVLNAMKESIAWQRKEDKGIKKAEGGTTFESLKAFLLGWELSSQSPLLEPELNGSGSERLFNFCPYNQGPWKTPH